jgi:DNA topoisomerase-1
MTVDKMIGFRLSPIAKTYVGAKSVGRVQSVGLKLVVDREHEIQNFKPETYLIFI